MKKLNSIMLVDDDDVSNFLFDVIVEDSGITEELKIFNKAETGLDYLLKTEGNPDLLPSAIFIDINMPRMTGWEFLNSLRKKDILNSEKTLVFMLSSSSHERDFQKVKSYPEVTEYLVKPITYEMVEELRKKYIHE